MALHLRALVGMTESNAPRNFGLSISRTDGWPSVSPACLSTEHESSQCTPDGCYGDLSTLATRADKLHKLHLSDPAEPLSEMHRVC